MGVRLIVEILDHWQDIGLTPGERGDLIVLAENANDASRETWGAVHAAHILKRAGKTAPSWRISVNRLMKKKALEFAKRDGKEVRGYTGQHAVYRIVELCPQPPHSGYKGHCTKPVAADSESAADDGQPPTSDDSRGDIPTAEGDTVSPSKEGYPSANAVGEDQEVGYLTANPEGYLTANAVEGLGYLTATERVSCQLTPTPLVSSFKDSSKDSPSSSVAEDSGEGSVEDSDGTEGGGGGDLDSSEDQEQDKPLDRAESFVDSLDYRGKQPGHTRRAKLTIRVAAAFEAGWSERGLMRYLDVSDDPNVRNPAAVYAHRLSEDELPDAPADPTVPPACWKCLGISPAAATDLAVRVNPITGDPCPDCHPDGRIPERLPEVCDACMRENPAARTNVRFRYRVIDDAHQACPDCHPKRIAILAAQNGQQDGADGGMWDRAIGRAQQRMQTGDWRGAGTDDRVAGWAAVANELRDEGQQPSTSDQRVRQAVEAGKRVQRQQAPLGRNYSNDVWQQPASPAESAKIPHCGDPNCDPVTRLKTEPDWTGEQRTSICGECHPAMKL